MKRLIMVVCVALCVVPQTQAQGRGGRQGGPGTAPTGTLCLNRSDVASIKTTDSTVNVNGNNVPVSEIVIIGKPGVGTLLNACPGGMGGDDPLGMAFFPPDLIMSHQQAIGLTDAQRNSIRTQMQDAQTIFVPMQFKMAAEVEKLQKLIAASQVDQGAVLEEVDRVLAIEREVKRGQLGLMVKLKNLLTSQQQDALARLRPED
jgi:Spy/CpxP family protein refolding chaperone